MSFEAIFIAFPKNLILAKKFFFAKSESEKEFQTREFQAMIMSFCFVFLNLSFSSTFISIHFHNCPLSLIQMIGGDYMIIIASGICGDEIDILIAKLLRKIAIFNRRNS
ncbi:hypothetical protein AB6A40_002867 [Gnathostoma spinigerum]|uniref:Uncharacterized protein n=1 Tax=Gnathostoma spinigerum TaxID=75299 RepID=A0ABD6E7Z5_9BILA